MTDARRRHRSIVDVLYRHRIAGGAATAAVAAAAAAAGSESKSIRIASSA